MIRKATEADMPELMRMAFEFHKAAHLRRYASFEESEEHWRAFLAKSISGDPWLCIMADGPMEAGFACALRFGAYWNPTIEVVNELALWVDRKSRGAGIGGQLIEAIATWAAGHKVKLVSAGSSAALHPKAMGSMLLKHGFELDEKIYSRRVA